MKAWFSCWIISLKCVLQLYVFITFTLVNDEPIKRGFKLKRLEIHWYFEGAFFLQNHCYKTYFTLVQLVLSYIVFFSNRILHIWQFPQNECFSYNSSVRPSPELMQSPSFDWQISGRKKETEELLLVYKLDNCF